MTSLNTTLTSLPRRGTADREPHDATDSDMLREENRQLRELVIQLSKLVIKNAAERY